MFSYSNKQSIIDPLDSVYAHFGCQVERYFKMQNMPTNNSRIVPDIILDCGCIMNNFNVNEYVTLTEYHNSKHPGLDLLPVAHCPLCNLVSHMTYVPIPVQK